MEQSKFPYMEVELRDGDGPSEPGITVGLPHFIEWALDRATMPFSKMNTIPYTITQWERESWLRKQDLRRKKSKSHFRP